MALKDFKYQRGRKVAEREGLDLLIASLPENIFYYSNFYNIGQAILHTTLAFLVYDPHNGKKIIVTSASDVPTILENGEVDDIFCVGGFQFHIPGDDDFSHRVRAHLQIRYASMVEALLAAVKKLRPYARKIALDESRVPAQVFHKTVTSMPEIEFSPGASIFQEIRTVKHPDEIVMLRKSVNITEDALFAAIKDIRPGVSERDIALNFCCEVTKRGGDPFFCVVTTDERAAFSDTYNQPFMTVKKGSMIRFDIGCIYQHYRSDIARTVIVGPNQQAEERYGYILKGLDEAISAIRPGVTVGTVFEIAESTVRAHIPHYRRHHCGHGIGLAIYDPPSIVAGGNAVLEEGMVLCIETPYYEIGWGGIQIEDTVVVTKDGAERLTATPNDLIRISL